MYELKIYNDEKMVAEFKVERYEDACEIEKVAVKLGYDVLWSLT